MTHPVKNIDEALVSLFDRFIDSGKVETGDYPFYDLLTEKGLIDLTDSQIREYYEKSKNLFMTVEMRKPIKQRRIAHFNKPRNLQVVFKAKQLVMMDFFESIKARNEHLKEYL